MIAGGIAAGLMPFAATRVGAQEATDPWAEEGFDSSGPSTRDFGFLPPQPKTAKYVRPIMFPVLTDPVLGGVSWSDTYLAPRSGGRLHEGQDLMGKKMLKLLAVCDGTIVELRHQSGGNSLYVKGDDGWFYCYLHINNDRPGTDDASNLVANAWGPGLQKYATSTTTMSTSAWVGHRVLKGDHLAYLGDSGNAEATGSHCHFEIRMPNAKWYNASAVNAYYSLIAAAPAKLRAKVPDSAFAPLANATSFATAQANDFLGGIPSSAWLAKAVGDLEGGVVTPNAFTEQILDLPGAAGVSAPTIRLYLGFFLRIPDYRGLDYWIRKVRAGTSLDVAASEFAGGTEFIRRYGQLNNAAYLKQIYQNLFDRDPDPSGADYWGRRLDAGLKRGALMRQFCESTEYKRKTASKVRVIQVYAAMVKHMPNAADYDYWTEWDAAVPDAGLAALIGTLREGAEYDARY